MTEEQIKIGAEYLAEIKSLNELGGILNTYRWGLLKEYGEITSGLNLLGTDHGKPNATKLQTTFGYGNRKLFSDIKDLIDVRVKELENDFKEL